MTVFALVTWLAPAFVTNAFAIFRAVLVAQGVDAVGTRIRMFATANWPGVVHGYTLTVVVASGLINGDLAVFT